MDLKMDYDTWDIATVNGQWETVEGIDAVLQKVNIRLLMFKGEWKLDLAQGFPWQQQVLGQKPDTTVVAALLTKAILTIPEVTDVRIEDVNYDGSTRVLSIGEITITALDQTVTINNFVVE